MTRLVGAQGELATARMPRTVGQPTVKRGTPVVRPAIMVGLGLWLGLATGLLELIVLCARRQFIDSTAVSALQLNQHALWMVPISHCFILGACGIVAGAVLGLNRSRWAALFGITCICFVAALSLLLCYRGLSTIAYLAFSGGVAVQVAPLFLRWLGRASRFATWSSLAMAGSLGVLVLARGWSERVAGRLIPPASAGAPNVLFIVLDTVRAQSLSLYGYDRDTSPYLIQLAQSGVRFDQARSTAAWTLPSHASMFTGRWAHELSTRPDRPLDATYPTLAGFLRDHGYATAGFVANTYFCSNWYGLGRGFVHYEDVAVVPIEVLRSSLLGRYLVRKLGPASRNRPNAYFDRKDAVTINQQVLSWLASERDGRPFFAFLNYYDAHDPYLTPAPGPRHFGLQPTSKTDLANLRDWLRVNKEKLAPRTRELARDCYDDCVAYLDDQLGRLFHELDARGLLENTVVVVTADHGEALGERGVFGHGQSLHREVINVPLLVVCPKKVPSGRVVATPVSLRDLPATVVDLLGLASQSPFPGRSLARHWSAGANAPSLHEEPILSETADEISRVPIGSSAARSLVENGKLYIRNKDGREELYDIGADPTESSDLAGTRAAQPLLTRFRAAMAQFDENATKWHDHFKGGGHAMDEVASAGKPDLCD